MASKTVDTDHIDIMAGSRIKLPRGCVDGSGIVDPRDCVIATLLVDLSVVATEFIFVDTDTIIEPAADDQVDGCAVVQWCAAEKRFVVWGVGSTLESAKEEAAKWYTEWRHGHGNVFGRANSFPAEATFGDFAKRVTQAMRSEDVEDVLLYPVSATRRMINAVDNDGGLVDIRMIMTDDGYVADIKYD